MSYTMGHLPIPDLAGIWTWIGGLVGQSTDINNVARKIVDEHGEELERELIKALNVAEEDYNELVEYGDWLNEYTPTTTLEGVEIGKEEVEEKLTEG